MTKEKLEQKFSAVWKKLDSLGYEEDKILGIFLYGSQNYKTDTPKSDFDFKVIVLPEFDTIINSDWSISKTYKLFEDSNEDLIEVKDIKTMMLMWKKSNPAYLEILGTPYFSTKKPLLIKELKEMNITKINPQGSVNALFGMALQKKKALTHPYPSKVDILEEIGYDPKQLHHIMRLNLILDSMYDEYVNKNNLDFNINDRAFNMTQDEIKYLNDVKNNKLFDKDSAVIQADIITQDMKRKVNEILDSNLLSFNKDIWENLNNWAIKIMKESFKKDIQN